MTPNIKSALYLPGFKSVPVPVAVPAAMGEVGGEVGEDEEGEQQVRRQAAHPTTSSG